MSRYPLMFYGFHPKGFWIEKTSSIRYDCSLDQEEQ